MTSVVHTFLFWGDSMIITFFGHSQYSGSEEDERRILSFLSEKVGEQSAELYLGGYGGFDLFARACGKKYQQSHPNTRLVLITPYMTLDYQKHHLEYEKGHYDAILYPALEHVPPKFAISHRNKWMIDKADAVVAYIRQGFGGAYQALRYAEKRQKEIFRI